MTSSPTSPAGDACIQSRQAWCRRRVRPELPPEQRRPCDPAGRSGMHHRLVQSGSPAHIAPGSHGRGQFDSISLRPDSGPTRRGMALPRSPCLANRGSAQFMAGGTAGIHAACEHGWNHNLDAARQNVADIDARVDAFMQMRGRQQWSVPTQRVRPCSTRPSLQSEISTRVVP